MRRLALFVLVVVAIGSAVAAAAAITVRQALATPVALEREVVFDIEPGERTRDIARRLEEAGVVRHRALVLLLARLEGETIKHGRHEFAGAVSARDAYAELVRPPKPVLRVTIPEGSSIHDAARILEESGATAAGAYLAVACSEELRRRAAAPETAACAEGFLFPDTYALRPGMSAGDVVALQLDRFEAVLDALAAQHAAAAAPPAIGDWREADGRARLVTLASIVEKETAVAAERPLIASVFYNRLRLGMPLQTDPTVIYGIMDAGQPWDGNLTKAHLREPTPYNTYTSKGLPAGPICNPGRAALEAALAPSESRYLYFVARGDGSHEFTTSLAEHNRAVRRYQLGGRRTSSATDASPGFSQLFAPLRIDLRSIFA